MTPEAAKMYKPRRPGTTLDDVVTPEERARRERDVQEAKDMAEQPKTDKAYMDSLTTDHKAAGGTASSRADGIAQRGKTRGTLVMCGGGYMKGKK
jgi:hypothetical protein